MTKKYVFGLFIVVGGLLSALHPLSASAQVAPQVFISEINWAGSSLSTADEWIKLYNAGPSDVDASGFVLTGAATSGQALSLADGTIIPASSTLFISNYDLGTKSVLTVKPDLVTTALSLPNSGLLITLTMADGTVLDEVNFGSTPHFGSTNPFTPAIRDPITLEWQTSTAEVVAEADSDPIVDLATNVGADPGIGPVDEIVTDLVIIEEPIIESPPVIEIMTPEQVVEETSPSISPISGGEIAEESIVPLEVIAETPTETVTTESIVGAPVIEPVIPELIIESTPSEIIEAVPTEIEAVTVNVPLEIQLDPVIYQEVTTESVIEEPANILNPVVATTESPATSEVTNEKFALDSVIINEIMSDPSDGIEWIELFNPGTEAIDLTDWSITDATDKATILSGTINPQSFFVIDAPKGRLNNDGDQVNIFDPSGATINTMSYGTDDLKAPKKGFSLSLIDNSWSETIPTKNTINQMTVTEETYDQSLPALDLTTTESEVLQDVGTESTQNDSRVSTTSATSSRTVSLAKPVSTPVKKVSTVKATTSKTVAKSPTSKTTTISGVVTALPGTFGDQIMFIDGIQVYANNKDWPALTIGDLVTIKGTLSTSHGEERIKIKTATDVLITGQQTLTATITTSDQISDMVEGQLVVVEGLVAERNGDRLSLEDDAGSMTIVAYMKTGLSWLDLPSSNLKITGVVRHIDNETLIYPRNADDVEFIEESSPSFSPIAGGVTTETTNIDWLSYLAYVLLGGTLSVLAFWFLRRVKSPTTTN